MSREAVRRWTSVPVAVGLHVCVATPTTSTPVIPSVRQAPACSRSASRWRCRPRRSPQRPVADAGPDEPELAREAARTAELAQREAGDAIESPRGKTLSVAGGATVAAGELRSGAEDVLNPGPFHPLDAKPDYGDVEAAFGNARGRPARGPGHVRARGHPDRRADRRQGRRRRHRLGPRQLGRDLRRPARSDLQLLPHERARARLPRTRASRPATRSARSAAPAPAGALTCTSRSATAAAPTARPGTRCPSCRTGSASRTEPALSDLRPALARRRHRMAAMSGRTSYERIGAAAVLTITRPERRNAVDKLMCRRAARGLPRLRGRRRRPRTGRVRRRAGWPSAPAPT